MPKSLWTSPWTSWLGWLPLICMAFAPYGIPKLIKRFITWPRTGYVANPNELKLIQLVMLMIFGGALGLGVSLPFILVSEIREAMSRPGAPGHFSGIVWHGMELLVCAILVVYLGRKTIRKRQPLPAAYDAALINQGLKQTTEGRRILRVVKSTLLVMFIGVPLVVGGVVIGLIYLRQAAMHRPEIHWARFGGFGLVVASNAILYLMVNAVAFKPHPWKWLALAIMVIGPVVVAPAVPYPAVEPGLIPISEAFPAFLSLGLVWFLSGAVTLMLFLRHHPLPPAGDA